MGQTTPSEGHGASSAHDHEHDPAEAGFWNRSETIVCGISGIWYLLGLVLEFAVPADLNPMLLVLGSYDLHLADAVFLLALVTGGFYTMRGGFRAVLSATMSIDFLITVALFGALALGKFVEAASLAFLYGVAELLEDYSMLTANRSLKELLELSPEEATVLRGGEERSVTVEDLEVGDTIVVRPGEKIAMDGRVVDGEGGVNEAPVTGESMPVNKTPGDEVFAGTFNEDGYLEVEVTRRAGDNTLARIIELVREAEDSQAPSQRFVDWFAGYYTPAVVGLALLVGIVVPFVPGVPGGFSTWWLRAMALLVIACPCGLLISTPVTVVSGITSAARQGTLIKGGEPFERLGQMDVVCFDKTGTLSEGEPSVSDIVVTGDVNEDEVLSLAASLEDRSDHPIAGAIVQEADRRNLTPRDVDSFESITAYGVSGRLDDETYYVGKPDLLDIDPSETFRELEEQGKTVVCVGRKGELLGIIGISDRLRPEARETVRALHDLNIETVMITGDNRLTARSVAEELGIDHYHADLMPEDKVDEVKHLQAEYGSIAMVGDGINDAPALAQADVGIAMGAAGSDTAIETADVALMGDNLDRLVYAVRLSRTGEGIIKQNIASAIGVKLLLAVGVIPGFVTLITAVLVGDMGVTFGITGNAMRLRWLK